MENQNRSMFATAQQIGKSLFLPIAVLPFAGMLLGIGKTFSNPATIETYGLDHVLHSGSLLLNFMILISNVGSTIFENLPLIFALAVALGMTKKEKEIAVFGAGIFYLVMLMTIHVFLVFDGSILEDNSINPNIKTGAIASVLGITTLQMGVLAGIISGIVTSKLCDYFYKIQLPPALSFFSGTRFIPIVCMVFGMVAGVIMYLIWPSLQNAIYALGGIVQSTGYFGTFLFGCIERLLLPFGLQHIFYLPFWQTGIGGTALIDGQIVMGAQNIFFAELSSPETIRFSTDACRFWMGRFPFMMAGLPAAALAMYACALAPKKKQAGSLFLSAALTSFLMGITEPIEFTFLFLSKELFAIHVIYAGISHALCHFLNIAVGTTCFCGIFDFILYGVMPGQAKTNWMMMLPIFVAYAIIYFVTFRFFIMKWDLKTPGREINEKEPKMISKDECHDATNMKIQKNSINISEAILKGVGGIDNVVEIGCCATRLRLTLINSSNINREVLNSTGASGIVVNGNGLQIVYGPSVEIVKSNLEDLILNTRVSKIDKTSVNINEGDNINKSIERDSSKMKSFILGAHLTGQVVVLDKVPDTAFSSRAIGDGVAIEPRDGKLVAPTDGIINLISSTKHALGMITNDGIEILMHIGIDTVKLNGKYFEIHVIEGQKVKRGDLLITFDVDGIRKAGYSTITPIVIINTGIYNSIHLIKSLEVKAGKDDLLEVLK